MLTARNRTRSAMKGDRHNWLKRWLSYEKNFGFWICLNAVPIAIGSGRSNAKYKREFGFRNSDFGIWGGN